MNDYRRPAGNEYGRRYHQGSEQEYREQPRVDYSQIPPDARVCWNCRKFERRTHFCRALPPKIAVFQDGPDNKVSSKFPVITKPEMDYCENEFAAREPEDYGIVGEKD